LRETEKMTEGGDVKKSAERTSRWRGREQESTEKKKCSKTSARGTFVQVPTGRTRCQNDV